MLHKLKSIVKGLIKGYYDHRLLENASSLSYYTLMSLVPILAVLFGIAKGFGIESSFKDEVIHAIPNQQALAEEIVQFAERMLERTKGSVIAGFGVLFLLWSFLGLLGNFEHTLNDIWHLKETRSFFRRIGDFLGFIFICPFFFVIFSSTTLFLSSELTDLFEKWELIDHFGPAIWFTFKLAPVFLAFLIFSFFYYYLPSVRPPIKPVLMGALITAVFFHLAQWAYVMFQINISSYGAIYGSFAAIPLFLLWVQLSWFITLLGAELSYRFSKL
ncbi:MAG: YihY/virulence factor BrkB family protein [Chlamydiia bacterium]|nr:YihY/virulence factor BrkB family protein [Chlamydiia bacterium]